MHDIVCDVGVRERNRVERRSLRNAKEHLTGWLESLQELTAPEMFVEDVA